MRRFLRIAIRNTQCQYISFRISISSRTEQTGKCILERRFTNPLWIHIFLLLSRIVQIHPIKPTDRKRQCELDETDGSEEDLGEGDVKFAAYGTHFGGNSPFVSLCLLCFPFSTLVRREKFGLAGCWVVSCKAGLYRHWELSVSLLRVVILFLVWFVWAISSKIFLSFASLSVLMCCCRGRTPSMLRNERDWGFDSANMSLCLRMDSDLDQVSKSIHY